jgi:hypothetical protein
MKTIVNIGKSARKRPQVGIKHQFVDLDVSLETTRPTENETQHANKPGRAEPEKKYQRPNYLLRLL